jgi:hypothetical protein
MKLLRFLLFFTVALLFLSKNIFSQTLSVGLMENIEDSYRRQQLLGKDSSGISYMIRPVNSSSAISNLFKPLYKSASSKAFVSALPMVWRHQYNTDHPYGMNDGSMIAAKGYQTQLSAGVFAKLGPLSVQLRPEFVFAENKDYRELHQANNGDVFIASYIGYIYNKIDLPGRFANGSYSHLNWGQSGISLTFDAVSFGLSNENLWWGPGMKSSLLMSNNAPGFKHLTLNTSKPVNTIIGSFEAQIVAGRLDPSAAPKIDDPRFARKTLDWRYLSGVAITYSPRWLPNLYLGLDRSFVIKKSDLGNGFLDYLPFFTGLGKSQSDNLETGIDDEDEKKRDQYASIFARWVLPQSRAEIYVQYGRNDHSWNLRDFIAEPEHSRAYIVGFRKLIGLKNPDEYIEFGVEAVQTQQSSTASIRADELWYAHYQVTSGYTNKGQVLGAGIGPSGNMQSFDVSWVHGLKKIGFVFDRIEQNNDLYLLTVEKSGIKKWSDLVFSGKFDWAFSNFILNSQLTYVHSKNYQYTPENAQNLSLKLGVLCYFK